MKNFIVTDECLESVPLKFTDPQKEEMYRQYKEGNPIIKNTIDQYCDIKIGPQWRESAFDSVTYCIESFHSLLCYHAMNCSMRAITAKAMGFPMVMFLNDYVDLDSIFISKYDENK